MNNKEYSQPLVVIMITFVKLNFHRVSRALTSTVFGSSKPRSAKLDIPRLPIV